MTMDKYIQKTNEDKRENGHKVKYKKSDGTYGYRIEKRDEKRLAYEVVFSCGNTSFEYDEFGKVRYDSKKRLIRPQEVPYEVNYAVANWYFEKFEERNPNFKIVNCVWHNDEGFYNKHNWHTPLSACLCAYRNGLQAGLGTLDVKGKKQFLCY